MKNILLVLGGIRHGQENINLMMVEKGRAWDCVRYNAGAEFTKAKEAKLSIWAAASPQPPRKFRHQRGASFAEPSAVGEKRAEAAQKCFYRVRNPGKTHNRTCKNFLDNICTGYCTNTPIDVDGKCCGGAAGGK